MANTKHTEQVKLRALAHYASSGSVTATAHAVGVPKQTLFEWVHSEQGIEQIGHLRTALRHAIAADLVEVSRKAIYELRDRLNNGDEIIIGRGDKVRRKVSGKDAMYIASNAINQLSLLTHDAKSVANANFAKLKDDLIASLNAASRIGQTIDAPLVTEPTKKIEGG